MNHGDLLFSFPGVPEIIQGNKIFIKQVTFRSAIGQDAIVIQASGGSYHRISVNSAGTLQIKNDPTLATGQAAQNITLTQDAVLGGLLNVISTAVQISTITSSNLSIVSNALAIFRTFANTNHLIISTGAVPVEQGVSFLIYQPVSIAPSNATVTALGTTVTGNSAGCNFLNDFKIGDTITMNGETHTVSAITDATHMTTDAWTNANTGFFTRVAQNNLCVLGNGLIGLQTLAPTAFLHLPAANGNQASLRIPSGTAPAAPNDGDIWFDGTNLKIRINAITNTLVQYKETTITSSTTPAPTGDARENYLYITALAAGATIAAPSGTPANGNILISRIKDDNTPRNLTWDPIFRASPDLPNPAVTVASKHLYTKHMYNSQSSTWDLLSALGNF